MAGVFTNMPIGYPPCTAQACLEILKYYNVPLSGKRAVVVGRSLVAVSYTHLDVYKRQVGNQLIEPDIPLHLLDRHLIALGYNFVGAFSCVLRVNLARSAGALVLDGLKPVSYTHLDVYKRQ